MVLAVEVMMVVVIEVMIMVADIVMIMVLVEEIVLDSNPENFTLTIIVLPICLATSNSTIPLDGNVELVLPSCLSI